MDWYKNKRIAHKLLLYFLFMFVLFTGMGLFNYYVSGNVSQNIQNMYKARVLSNSLLSECSIKYKDTEALALRLLMTPNKSRMINLKAIIEGNFEDIEKLLQEYEVVQLEELEKSWLVQLREKQKSYYDNVMIMFDLVFNGRQEEAYTRYAANASIDINNINILLQVMSSHNKKMAEEQYREANKLVNVSLMVIYIVPFLGAVCCLLLWYFINKKLTSPLNALIDNITDVANGNFKNLQNSIQVDSNDEIGLLAQRFNKMAYTLDNYMKVLTEKNEIIKYQANHDPLTGLANRRMLNKKLNAFIRKARLSKARAAILYIDLDNFKIINDANGHIWGDELLKKAAKRLHKTCRRNDLVSRLGGDEFLIIAFDIENLWDAEIIAQKIIEAIAQPIHLGEKEINITTSIGISIYPDDGEKYFDLLKAADTALYQAKRRGKNTYQFYNKNNQF